MTINDMMTIATGSRVKSTQTGGIFTVVLTNDNGFDLVSEATGKHLVTRVSCDAAKRPVGWTTPEPTSSVIRWDETLAAKVAANLEVL